MGNTKMTKALVPTPKDLKGYLGREILRQAALLHCDKYITEANQRSGVAAVPLWAREVRKAAWRG